MSTKTLGVIGGMGPQASASFYELLISNTKAQKDQDHIDVLLYSHASIPDRTESILNFETDKVIIPLTQDIKRLIEFGSDYIVITCNTSHLFIEELRRFSSVPIISLIEVTVEYLLKKNIASVGLLATDGTVKTNIYSDKIAQQGIEVVIPEPKDQRKIMDIIYHQVKKGIPVDEKMFFDVVAKLKEKSVEAVILGCTELSVYGSEKKLDPFFINPQELLAKKCIRLCGGKLIEES